jgi:hypothetical protein
MGSYKSVAKTVLPTIVLAINTTSKFVNIKESDNKKLFIFDNQNYNLAYDFE